MIFYSEWDPYPAQWLRNLVVAGELPEGEVDERSIEELEAADCSPTSHFFAGIGGWPLALRLAGWPPGRPVWTGSCPCQPFSTAGKGQGADDARHLWPAWFRLIRECRPPAIFGEQVASSDGRDWLAAVRADLESLGYRVGAADLCAAGVGAPHIRQRLFWVADTERERTVRGTSDQEGPTDARPERTRQLPPAIGPGGRDGGMADTSVGTHHASEPPTEQRSLPREDGGDLRGVVDAEGPGSSLGGRRRGSAEPRPERSSSEDAWLELEWLPYADGVARPTQPKLLPLADGLPGRVGRIRAYGNAIVPQVGAAFVRAYLEATA